MYYAVTVVLWSLTRSERFLWNENKLLLNFCTGKNPELPSSVLLVKVKAHNRNSHCNCFHLMCCVEKHTWYIAQQSSKKLSMRVIISRVIVYLLSTLSQNLKFQYQATQFFPYVPVGISTTTFWLRTNNL